MPIFGKKKEEVKLPVAEEFKMNVEPFKPVEQPKEIQAKQERPASAPLFIKLDRYKQILNSLAELKTALVMIKNSFSVMNELEKLKNENLKMIENVIERIDKRISGLDSEFLKPSGYREELPEEVYEVESLGATLTDLRDQVNQLKAELESLT